MSKAKRPNCPACKEMVRFADSVARTEYGNDDRLTLVTRIWHKTCLITANPVR